MDDPFHHHAAAHRRKKAKRIQEEDEDTFFLMLLAGANEKDKTPVSRHVAKYRATAKAKLLRLRCCVPRPALLLPWKSAWEAIYAAGSDQALTSWTGFDCEAFRDLHVMFEPYYNNFSPKNLSATGQLLALEKPYNKGDNMRGRPRHLGSKACLGLALAYYRSQCPEYLLAVFFGVTHSVYNVWRRFSMMLLVDILEEHPLAKPTPPDAEKVTQYQAAILAKYPALTKGDDQGPTPSSPVVKAR
jgi:hypothetical protein